MDLTLGTYQRFTSIYHLSALVSLAKCPTSVTSVVIRITAVWGFWSDPNNFNMLAISTTSAIGNTHEVSIERATDLAFEMKDGIGQVAEGSGVAGDAGRMTVLVRQWHD